MGEPVYGPRREITLTGAFHTGGPNRPPIINILAGASVPNPSQENQICMSIPGGYVWVPKEHLISDVVSELGATREQFTEKISEVREEFQEQLEGLESVVKHLTALKSQYENQFKSIGDRFSQQSKIQEEGRTFIQNQLREYMGKTIESSRSIHEHQTAIGKLHEQHIAAADSVRESLNTITTLMTTQNQAISEEVDSIKKKFQNKIDSLESSLLDMRGDIETLKSQPNP